MSEFDKEAERERLREKYEQDREKRASTQRMSELLLKGATMTNNHCDACGDPIFRYDGEEFCPTCQAPNADAEDASSAAAEADADPAETGADATGADADPAETGADAQAVRDETDTEAGPSAPAVARDRRPAPTGGDADPPAADRSRGAAGGRGAGTGAAPDLDDTRASLSRTLDRFARAAEETDDPRRARELLAAAREAAETLAALDGRSRF
ncbi:hypothetical protein EI982_12125 [Haloplanus rallus]|uniref:Sjogrens syndrome scleroderma autoantigen 1 n=1 Tax=Haloplanus rallus TaxID=1816183 RepID=A0A6B9FAV5_9EURY|nr:MULTISPECIES: Sjogren's syndrome/scleroderma autoantigen 1 family protein [Haloplanus]QGX95481.1 hypothetical protein EI982_12125 [Haloplanus rallus]